ncbi:MAG: hypothetical protein R2800_00905 [Flavipsychrobacter sp.]
MPYKYLLLSIATFFLFTACNTERKVNCEQFKDGRFKIEDTANGTSYIVRNGKHQTEILNGQVDSSTFIVNWIGECEYTLTPTQETRERYYNLPDDAMLTIKINETKENSYIQTTSANFSETKVTNEVIRIK